jgi:hypothetical protein
MNVMTRRGVENGLMAGISGGLLSGLSASLNGRDFWWGHQRKQTFNGRDYYFYRNENRAYSKAMKIANGNEVSTYTADDLVIRNRKFNIVADPVSAGNSVMKSRNAFTEIDGNVLLENSLNRVTSQTHYAFAGDGYAYPSIEDAALCYNYKIPVTHVTITNNFHDYYKFNPSNRSLLENFIFSQPQTAEEISSFFYQSSQNGNIFIWLLK